jgi:hypothetical protein
VFRIIGTGGRYTSSFTEPHRKKSKGSDLKIADIRTRTTLGQPIAQATAYSRMLWMCDGTRVTIGQYL